MIGGFTCEVAGGLVFRGISGLDYFSGGGIDWDAESLFKGVTTRQRQSSVTIETQ